MKIIIWLHFFYSVCNPYLSSYQNAPMYGACKPVWVACQGSGSIKLRLLDTFFIDIFIGYDIKGHLTWVACYSARLSQFYALSDDPCPFHSYHSRPYGGDDDLAFVNDITKAIEESISLILRIEHSISAVLKCTHTSFGIMKKEMCIIMGPPISVG
jgi:hypothetical protein